MSARYDTVCSLVCDWPGCGQQYTWDHRPDCMPHDPKGLRACSDTFDWFCTPDGKDYCPEHRHWAEGGTRIMPGPKEQS